ncbi:hypothetical protein YC2023_010562 [Brassica napus]
MLATKDDGRSSWDKKVISVKDDGGSSWGKKDRFGVKRMTEDHHGAKRVRRMRRNTPCYYLTQLCKQHYILEK